MDGLIMKGNLVAPFLSSLQEEISRLVLGFFLAYTIGTIHKKYKKLSN
jgi:hypothetical protein